MTFYSVRGRVARLTKVDECGVPVPGPTSMCVTDGFISVKYDGDYKAGEATEVLNAAGEIAIEELTAEQLKWYKLDVAFTGINPDAKSLMSGTPTVLDYAGNDVGLRVGRRGESLGAFALEVWTDVPGSACYSTSTSRKVTDGVLSGSTALASATAAFTAADVGASVSGTGIPAGATIVSQTGTAAVMSAAASASATGVSVTIAFAGGSFQQYGYFLLPFIIHGVIGDFQIDSKALSLHVTARTSMNPGWGTGPYLVVPTSPAQTPGKLLTPMGKADHLHLQLTTVPPPELTDGLAPLVPAP